MYNARRGSCVVGEPAAGSGDTRTGGESARAKWWGRCGRAEGRMAVISATGTRKRILGYPPTRSGPLRDPVPVTTQHSLLHSFHSSISHVLPLVSLSLSLPRFLSPSSFPLSLSLILLAPPARPVFRSARDTWSRFPADSRRNGRPGGAPAQPAMQLHTNPALFSGRAGYRSTRPLAVKPRSRPRPCLPAKIGDVPFPRRVVPTDTRRFSFPDTPPKGCVDPLGVAAVATS